MKIIRGITKPRGLRIVVYGVHGIGKTTLASKLPNALFLDYENGTHGIEVAKADDSDLPRAFPSVVGVFKEFKRDNQGFRNIIIDTADKLEEALDHAYSQSLKTPVDSVFTVNDYGRTVSGFTTEFGTMLDSASELVNSGVNLIVLAHEQSRKKEVLEGTQTYDHSELKLSKGNTKLLMQWADAVIFCAFKTTFVAEDKKTGSKAHAEGGKRWCYTAYSNDWEAKHRACIELPDDCSLDRMAELLPKAIEAACDQSGASAKTVQTVASKPDAEQAAKDALAKKRGAASANKPDQPAAAKPSEEPKKEPVKEPQPKNEAGADLPEAAQQFVKLLKQYDLAEEDMRKYAAGKLNDRYGVDFTTLPLAEWPEEALNWLNRGFDKIAPQIKK